MGFLSQDCPILDALGEKEKGVAHVLLRKWKKIEE